MAKTDNNDFREFALNALRPALMMIIRWIEKKYILPASGGPMPPAVPAVFNATYVPPPVNAPTLGSDHQ